MARTGTKRRARTADQAEAAYASLTDAEMLQELSWLCDALLGRLNLHLCVGTGYDGEETAVPEALDLGLALHGKLDVIASQLMFGTTASQPNLIGWNWGLRDFEQALREAAANATLGDRLPRGQ